MEVVKTKDDGKDAGNSKHNIIMEDDNCKQVDKEQENCCRICLNKDNEMYSLFHFSISTDKVLVVDFLRKITGLNLHESDTMPNTICSSCIEKLVDVYNFTQLCINSDKILHNSETRRLLRKIEEEALTEYSKCEDRINTESCYYFKSTAVHDTFSGSPKIIETKLYQTKYLCQICCMDFTNKTKFLQHKKTHNESSFKCAHCSQAFAKKEYLDVHLRSHLKNEEKKFICKICNAHFTYEYLLRQHEFKHSDEKPFPCTKCDKGCLTAESLKRHMRIHDETYVKKSCCCIICSKEFAYPSSLAEHMKNHTGEKPHLCSVCGKAFRQRGALHFHQRIHTGYKPFKCKFCEENFRSMSKLKAHMRAHTNERPFICDICGVAFKQSSDLKSHKLRHDGQKEVMCSICGKKMSSAGQLTVHLRTHTGEKPHSCEICSKSFTTKALLNKHNRTHTGERPYICAVCGKTFGQSSTLNVHSKIHRKNCKKKINTKKKKECRNENTVEVKDAKDGSKKNIENVTTITVVLPAAIPLIQMV